MYMINRLYYYYYYYLFIYLLLLLLLLLFNWMILFLLFLLHGYMKGRFNRDLKEHSTQDGYEKGKKERDKKVLGRVVFNKLTKKLTKTGFGR